MITRAERERLLIELDRQDAEESLLAFIRMSWDIIEPAMPFVEGWHLAFICDHLEAITDGVQVDGKPYNRLLINVPPGHMKSLLMVFWQAWEWGPCNLPHMRYISASHNQDLAVRDTLRLRRLVSSDWYQARWPHVVFSADQNQKTKIENTASGFRMAAAAGSITGARGDRVIIDDPHSTDGAASEAMRNSTNQWFLEAVPTRLNSPVESAIVVIMQRLHMEDVSGLILDGQLGYDHICLPTLYDPSRNFPTKLGYTDPRTVDGELLFPERFPMEVVQRDRKAMGEYAFAGQMQQLPAPRGGGIIKDDWWLKWEGAFPPFDYIVASLDTAYSEKTSADFSAMTFWGVFSFDPISSATQSVAPDGSVMHIERSYGEMVPRVMLIDAWQAKLTLHDLAIKVVNSCKQNKIDRLLIESTAAGISLGQELRRLLSYEAFTVQMMPVGRLDKEARLNAISHLFQEGIVYAPDKDWADMVIQQVGVFPKGKNDDLVDTVSQAISHLRATSMLVRGPEHTAELDDVKRFTGKAPPPLYPS